MKPICTNLPIDAALPELLEQLATHDTVILIAEPGAGKTTRVPPAILEAGLAQRQIILLQPRRVAARAAAAYIAQQRGTRLGDEIGYQVRHESKISKDTRIIACTQGVFLRQLQSDPLLQKVDTVIFDEFHERSLDGDLALALVRQVQRELRPDLKIVIMSATLNADAMRFYIPDAPLVQSAGRAYPVEIEYLQAQSRDPIEKQVLQAIRSTFDRTDGHILVFLPGVGEIYKTATAIGDFAKGKDLELLTLYGDMPLAEQQRVLSDTFTKRKLILATNVAETSLTIPGVTQVIDSGLARVNRLDTALGLNRLVLEQISRASAEQRAGRAGRTSEGHCLRLWQESQNKHMPDYTSPEVERVDLSEAALQLLFWGETNLANFPWFQNPPIQALAQALRLLDLLGATHQGALTEHGKAMAQLPLQPRLAKLMLQGAKLGCLSRAAICAAMLSERDPIKRRPSVDRHAPATSHSSESDVLDRVWALEKYRDDGQLLSIVGELSANAAKSILRTSDQLQKLIKDEAPQSEQHNTNDDTPLLQAIALTFIDRLCKRRSPNSDRALMAGGRGVRLAAQTSAVDKADLFVAVELMETGSSETSVRLASIVERSWLPPESIVTQIEVTFDTQKDKITAYKRTRCGDLILEETIAPLPPDVDAGAALAQAITESRYDLDTLFSDADRQLIARIACLHDAIPEAGLPDAIQLADSSSPLFREQILPEWCFGATSVAELKTRSFSSILLNQLDRAQQALLASEAPETITVPSGSKIAIHYEQGKPPVLAVRIQEVFGMASTPRIAHNRVPVLMHLLAPNYRVQQITDDLANFWANTYADVKKDLKARYPKHSWPDDPMQAEAIRGAKKRQL